VRLYHDPLGPIRALGEVIEKPAERFGVTLDPGLSSQIVEDVRTADALPLLAYTLWQLYEQYGGDRELTLDEYRKLGGVQNAIGARLGQVLIDPALTADEFAALRRAFTRHLIRVERVLRKVSATCVASRRGSRSRKPRAACSTD
jgi:hypothetical protein